MRRKGSARFVRYRLVKPLKRSKDDPANSWSYGTSLSRRNKVMMLALVAMTTQPSNPQENIDVLVRRVRFIWLGLLVSYAAFYVVTLFNPRPEDLEPNNTLFLIFVAVGLQLRSARSSSSKDFKSSRRRTEGRTGPTGICCGVGDNRGGGNVGSIRLFPDG